MDSLARAVEAADSVWPVVAIGIIGLYVLLWRFGGPLLQMIRESNDVTRTISESILTNHGSKNIGDAVDRLTVAVGELADDVHNAFEALDARVSWLEEKEAERAGL